MKCNRPGTFVSGLACTRPANHAPGCVYESAWALDVRHDDQTQEED